MTATTPDAGRAAPDPHPRHDVPQRATRLVRVVLVAFSLVLSVVALDSALLTGRLDRLDVDLHAGAGTTWVLVGLDSRAQLPTGADLSAFGTPQDVPGSRADVVLVVHVSDAGATTVLSVPRDVVVDTGRLALTWLDGPQATLDGLCSLGIPSDHLVTVDLAGFAALVDAAGGVDVDVPRPVRDPAAGLELRTVGSQHLDGDTALAIVRSRHPQELVDGDWVPAAVDPDGRASAAGLLLDALADSVRARPWRVQDVAWAASGALAVDGGTSLGSLAALLTADPAQPRVLPVGPAAEGTWARFPTPATSAAVAAAGLACAVEPAVS